MEALTKDIDTTFGTLINELSKFDEKTLDQSTFAEDWTAVQAVEHTTICGNDIPGSRAIEANRAFDESQCHQRAVPIFGIKFGTDSSIAPGTPLHIGEGLLQKIKEIKLYLTHTARKLETHVQGYGTPGLRSFDLLAHPVPHPSNRWPRQTFDKYPTLGRR